MSVGKTVLQGSTVEKNGLPPRASNPAVTLKGTFHGSRAAFDLTEDVLSKHMMLIGGTGCGKSTLLRTLMMLMEENCQIDKGAVFFEETDLTKLSEKELRLLRGKDIVMIFQNAALSSNPLHKIGHQFYETITSHSGKMSKKECYAKAEDILKKLKFKEPKRILNSYPFELSGGMNQIGRAHV